MSLVNWLACVLNQAGAAKCDLPDLALRQVVNRGVVIGAVVTKIAGSWSPEVVELALEIPASEPVKLHVY